MKISTTIAILVTLFATYVTCCNRGNYLTTVDLCAGEVCLVPGQCASGNCYSIQISDDGTTRGFCSLEGYQWALIIIGAVVFCAGIIVAGICCFRCFRRRKLGRDLHAYGQIHH